MEHVLLIPFDDLHTFLLQLGVFVTTDDRAAIQANIDHVLLAVLWPDKPADYEYDRSLASAEFHFEGTATNYIEMTRRHSTERRK